MCVCMCVFKRDISISPPYDVWIFFTDEYCSGVNIFQGWTFFNSNLEFAQITLVLLYAILCKNTIGLRKLSKKIVQRSDLANKTKTTTNVNQPNPTNTLPIRIQTYKGSSIYYVIIFGGLGRPLPPYVICNHLQIIANALSDTFWPWSFLSKLVILGHFGKMTKVAHWNLFQCIKNSRRAPKMIKMN